MQITKLVTACAVAYLFTIILAVGSAQAKDIYYGSVSTSPSPVHVAGQNLFTIQADAGGFTAAERTLIVERNIINALMATTDRSPLAVSVETINNLPVIRLGGFHIVTIDSNTSTMLNTPMNVVAVQWADNLRKVLADETAVSLFLSQLGGNYLGAPYVVPDFRARHEAARLNHAAIAYREDLPIDLVSSESLATLGVCDLGVDRNVDTAMTHFRDAIALDYRDARAHYGLGVCLLKKSRVQDAIDELQTARMFEPDYAMVHLALGQAFETQGRDVAAVKQFQEAALLQPDNPVPYLMIADIREDRNDMRKSVDELQAAQQIIPDSQYIRLRKEDQLAWRLRQPM